MPPRAARGLWNGLSPFLRAVLRSWLDKLSPTSIVPRAHTSLLARCNRDNRLKPRRNLPGMNINASMGSTRKLSQQPRPLHKWFASVSLLAIALSWKWSAVSVLCIGFKPDTCKSSKAARSALQKPFPAPPPSLVMLLAYIWQLYVILWLCYCYLTVQETAPSQQPWQPTEHTQPLQDTCQKNQLYSRCQVDMCHMYGRVGHPFILTRDPREPPGNLYIPAQGAGKQARDPGYAGRLPGGRDVREAKEDRGGQEGQGGPGTREGQEGAKEVEGGREPPGLLAARGWGSPRGPWGFLASSLHPCRHLGLWQCP
jgi:hypothetical protein